MNKLVKSILLVAVIPTFVAAYWECLNCKFMDTNAGFLFSYSYCEIELLDERICVPDSWNIINK